MGSVLDNDSAEISVRSLGNMVRPKEYLRAGILWGAYAASRNSCSPWNDSVAKY